ncbi:hypothetical protein CsSME_00044689 [Camellia sinensis var. sinensis]
MTVEYNSRSDLQKSKEFSPKVKSSIGDCTRSRIRWCVVWRSTRIKRVLDRRMRWNRRGRWQSLGIA